MVQPLNLTYKLKDWFRNLLSKMQLVPLQRGEEHPGGLHEQRGAQLPREGQEELLAVHGGAVQL
jgi:hypothetical protein